MSIYSQLLVAALGVGEHDPNAVDRAQLVADLAQWRSRLERRQGPTAPDGGVTAAVADQLAYDLALTALCRHADVPFDVAEFDRPQDARGRLEAVLVEMGLVTGTSELPMA
jgi:hypothetical protein